MVGGGTQRADYTGGVWEDSGLTIVGGETQWADYTGVVWEDNGLTIVGWEHTVG